MKKLLLICMVMFVFGLQSINAQEYNFEPYIYPLGFRTYYTNSEEKFITFSEFSFTSQYSDNFLVKEVYIGVGVMSSKTYYRYRVEGNAVISDVQIIQSALGNSRRQDKITLFAFPNNDKPYKWTETVGGDKYQCTSEYAYIQALIFEKSMFLKAIKITRDLSFVSDNKKHRIIETSYWVSDFGRLVTKVDWDGAKHSDCLDLVGFVEEMPEEVYKKHINE